MTFHIEITIPDDLNQSAERSGVTEEILIERAVARIAEKARHIIQQRIGTPYEQVTAPRRRSNPFLYETD